MQVKEKENKRHASLAGGVDYALHRKRIRYGAAWKVEGSVLGQGEGFVERFNSGWKGLSWWMRMNAGGVT